MNVFVANLIILVISIFVVIFCYYKYLNDTTIDKGVNNNDLPLDNSNTSKTIFLVIVIVLCSLLGFIGLILLLKKLVSTFFTKTKKTKITFTKTRQNYIIERNNTKEYLKLKRVPGDRKCLYHSLLTTLKDAKINTSLNTLKDLQNKETKEVDLLMGKVYEAYSKAIQSKDDVLQALKDDFSIEMSKIQALLQERSLPKEGGYPDIGTIQLLVQKGLFPYNVNIGLISGNNVMITKYNDKENDFATIFVTQSGGNKGLGGHFDALIQDRQKNQIVAYKK